MYSLLISILCIGGLIIVFVGVLTSVNPKLFGIDFGEVFGMPFGVFLLFFGFLVFVSALFIDAQLFPLFTRFLTSPKLVA